MKTKHHGQMSESFLTAVFLSLSGGLQDAYTYLFRGKVFANAQTGNIVLLSSNIMDGQWDRVLHYLVPLCAFALGVLVAEKMRESFCNMQRLHWRQLVVLGEVLLLFIVGFLPQEQNLLANAIVSFSCAMQVQAFRKVNGYAFASTMCIGDLRSGVEAFCIWSKTHEPKVKDRMMRYFGIILLFAVGAGIGSMGAARLAGKQRGWLGVVMHFRGCSGEPNRNHRIYHSGETEDGTWFLHWLKREFGPAPTAAVGYSLGGNMLGCLLAEEGDRCPLDAAVIVSAPFMLEACSYHMDKGFSRVYQRYLLNLLKANASRKLKAYPGSLPVDLRQLKGMRRIREFDDMITAKIHGFADALDYYRQCSAMPRLSDITKPTLIIHAKDDPFMDHHSIPPQEQLPANVEYQLTEQGGHVGFVSGTLRKPEMWLERRIPDWLNRWLEVPA